ncbi:MAG: FAD-dependent oxidoreductase [Brachybacterium sp.]|nr:FAD-dependent oxidoreductase [Brachybacterium sp.]
MDHIIVIGSGYAGLLAANRLAHPSRRITLLSPGGEFVDRIRLHEVAAGVRDTAATPVAALVRTRVTVLDARAVHVGEGVVALQDGRRLFADRILLATGSTAAARLPGTHRVDTHATAHATRRALRAVRPDGLVDVIGAGLTGIETATEIATAHGTDLRVRLIGTTEPGADLSPSSRRALHASLARLRIEHSVARIDLATLHDIASPADLTIDATGMRPAPLAADSGLPMDPTGRVLVGPDLRVRGSRTLWAAGDGACLTSAPGLRRSCALAVPMGVHAADEIVRSLQGRRAAPFRFGYVARCISLGRRDGLIQFVAADDTPTARAWSGRPAALAKELVCRLATAAPTRLSGTYTWRRATVGS